MNRNASLQIIASTFALLLLLTGSQAAQGQLSRTWVSSSGSDVNDCNRATPCRTLSGALVKTFAGGEIDVLDSGGFGPVTLNKSISIVAPGVLGGIIASSGTAITINAGLNDRIVLRGLTIEGQGTGTTGISFIAGGALSVESCTINGFTGHGMELAPTGASQFNIMDTTVSNSGLSVSGAGGILIRPSGAGSAKAVISRTNVENNTFGIRSDGTMSTGGINVTVNAGFVSGNFASGVISVSNSALTQVIVDGTTISNNGFGVRADGSAATLRFGRTTISGNGMGMSTASGGQLFSYGTNQVDGNTDDGVSPVLISTK